MQSFKSYLFSNETLLKTYFETSDLLKDHLGALQREIDAHCRAMAISISEDSTQILCRFYNKKEKMIKSLKKIVITPLLSVDKNELSRWM